MFDCPLSRHDGMADILALKAMDFGRVGSNPTAETKDNPLFHLLFGCSVYFDKVRK